jgi:hypothetical protein
VTVDPDVTVETAPAWVVATNKLIPKISEEDKNVAILLRTPEGATTAPPKKSAGHPTVSGPSKGTRLQAGITLFSHPILLSIDCDMGAYRHPTEKNLSVKGLTSE